MNEVMQQIRQLIIDNPELEIVPFVGGECGNPDYAWVLSEFKRARVDEFATSPYSEERIHFKSDGWSGNFKEDFYDNDSKDRGGEIPDKEIIQAFEDLEWQKAIIIYIDAY